MKPKVSIIITTMNRKNKLKNCIDSIWQNSYKNIELIVIDNSSSDGTVNFLNKLKNEHINIKIIFNQTNLGLAKARNQGISVSRGKFVLFIDDDNVIDKHMIKNMLYLFEHEDKIGIIAPKTFYKENPYNIWFYGANINLLTSKAYFFNHHITDREDKINYNLQINCVHNCFIVKKELFNKVGNFDDNLFVSYTEFDLCMRAKKYYTIYLCGKAKCYHDRPSIETKKSVRNYGFTNPYRAYYLARNRGIIVKRYSNAIQKKIFLFIFYPVFITYYAIILLRYKRIDLLKYHLQGTFAGIYYILFNRYKKTWLH